METALRTAVRQERLACVAECERRRTLWAETEDRSSTPPSLRTEARFRANEAAVLADALRARAAHERRARMSLSGQLFGLESLAITIASAPAPSAFTSCGILGVEARDCIDDPRVDLPGLLRQPLDGLGRDLLGLGSRTRVPPPPRSRRGPEPTQASEDAACRGTETLEHLVEDPRLLVRRRLAEEPAQHLLEGRGLVRVEGVADAVGERARRRRPPRPCRRPNGCPPRRRSRRGPPEASDPVRLPRPMMSLLTEPSRLAVSQPPVDATDR